MANRPEPEESIGGAPEWMVTFSDCMTLLLTFFVLLLSFSSYDDKNFKKMTTSLSTALPSISVAATRSRDSVVMRDEIIYQRDRDKGSESPTEDQSMEGNIKESSNTISFDDRKVFLIPSDQLFLGGGTGFSKKGRELLSKLGQLLDHYNNKIVISENKQSSVESANSLGYQRAWQTMEYLIKNSPLDKNRFAITACSTVSTANLSNSLKNGRSGRIVEIVLLDKSLSK